MISSINIICVATATIVLSDFLRLCSAAEVIAYQKDVWLFGQKLLIFAQFSVETLI